MPNDLEVRESNKEDLLEIFFDESFVPQAFVDILLSTTKAQDANQLQHTSSSLLTRLDFYTRHLTSELEGMIFNLEKLSETLSGTWSADPNNVDENDKSSNKEMDYNSQLPGASKLEYYLETLGSAVRTVETDIGRIDKQLKGLDVQYNDDTDVIDTSKKLELAEERLNNILNRFLQLKKIMEISVIAEDESSKSTDKNNNKNKTITLNEFTESLDTLEGTINQSFIDSAAKETTKERNVELLKKVDEITKLVPLFKGLNLFYEEYSRFANEINTTTQSYLSTKDIDEDFNI